MSDVPTVPVTTALLKSLRKMSHKTDSLLDLAIEYAEAVEIAIRDEEAKVEVLVTALREIYAHHSNPRPFRKGKNTTKTCIAAFDAVGVAPR